MRRQVWIIPRNQQAVMKQRDYSIVSVLNKRARLSFTIDADRETSSLDIGVECRRRGGTDGDLAVVAPAMLVSRGVGFTPLLLLLSAGEYAGIIRDETKLETAKARGEEII